MAEQGGMHKVISLESIGGNAGFWNKHPCAGANFQYECKTGKIIIFGNIQDIPDKIRKTSEMGTFSIAVNIKIGKLRIINTYINQNCIKETKEILEKTVEEYNKRYGFEA